jgi:hypothetical protein
MIPLKTLKLKPITVIVFAMLLVVSYWLLVEKANAQQPKPILDGVPQAPITSITSLAGTATSPLTVLVRWFIGIFWIVAVAMVVWAAFLYLTAGGNEEKITEAKKRLLYAVIAAAIALMATGIDFLVEMLLKGSLVS